MLAAAVNTTDLDTMRACYMMEAYGEKADDKGDRKADEVIVVKTDEKPAIEKATSAAQAQTGTAQVASSQVASSPQPLDSFGHGHSHVYSSHAASITARPAPADAHTEAPSSTPAAATNLVAKAGRAAAN